MERTIYEVTNGVRLSIVKYGNGDISAHHYEDDLLRGEYLINEFETRSDMDVYRYLTQLRQQYAA